MTDFLEALLAGHPNVGLARLELRLLDPEVLAALAALTGNLALVNTALILVSAAAALLADRFALRDVKKPSAARASVRLGAALMRPQNSAETCQILAREDDPAVRVLEGGEDGVDICDWIVAHDADTCATRAPAGVGGGGPVGGTGFMNTGRSNGLFCEL